MNYFNKKWNKKSNQFYKMILLIELKKTIQKFFNIQLKNPQEIKLILISNILNKILKKAQEFIMIDI